MANKKEYILGTNEQELNRLQLQHKVWKSEAKRGWDFADFKSGDTILDLGCGPGYCTEELAYIVGEKGKVIGIDRSDAFIDHLQRIKKSTRLSIEPYLTEFDTILLESNSLDGAYCRWALAWISNPKEILSKIKDALKPKGKIVTHEYFNFSTHQTNPERPALKKAIGTALKSFQESNFEINVGSYLPQYLEMAKNMV